jgi:hypothetical protein
MAAARAFRLTCSVRRFVSGSSRRVVLRSGRKTNCSLGMWRGSAGCLLVDFLRYFAHVVQQAEWACILWKGGFFCLVSVWI